MEYTLRYFVTAVGNGGREYVRILQRADESSPWRTVPNTPDYTDEREAERKLRELQATKTCQLCGSKYDPRDGSCGCFDNNCQ